MARKKRKKTFNPTGRYKNFLRDLQHFIKRTDLFTFKLSKTEKKHMYESRIQMRPPVASNNFVTVLELNKIHAKTKEMHHKPTFNYKNQKISTYEMLLMYCYSNARLKQYEKELGKNHCKYLEMQKAVNDASKTSFQFYLLDFYSAITKISNPEVKYYGASVRFAPIVKDNPRLEVVTEIIGVPAQKSYFLINNINRPAFRIGRAVHTGAFEWASIKASHLPTDIQYPYSSYYIYIQSHALNRMKERLDLLDRESINYTIWQNTSRFKIIRYKQLLLLTVKVHEVNIGYFVSEIIDDKIVIKTFLFITHNSTPEGDKLKEITGLGKSDISYWKIDRLSTFVNLDKEKYPKLMQLFSNAGMQELSQLKTKEFDIDSIQAANFDGLRKYIEESMKYTKERELHKSV